MSTISVNNITPYTGNSVNINGMVVNNSELTLNTLTSNTLSATTVSATTFYGDGSHLTGISGGTGGGLITRTKAEMDVLIAANGLIAGNFYMITGVDEFLYGGTDIILQAITTNELSVKGSGIFYNPKYNQEIVGYGVWSNLMTVFFTSANGVFDNNELVFSNNNARGYYVADGIIHYLDGDWSNATFICGTTTSATAVISSGTTSPVYAVGDNVIWGGKHWVNVSGDSISVVGKVVATGDTSNSYSFYLLDEIGYGEVIPNSIVITDGVETFTDNGMGLLAGSMGGTGYINYFNDNGHVGITFDSPVLNGTLITATFNYRQLPFNDFTLPSSWEEIPFNDVDYVKVVDAISYDYDHNVIIGREDEVGNSVSSSYATINSEAFFMGSGLNSIKVFQWGNITKNFNIRGRFNFTDEGQGNLINDGGYDMYDNGNQMSTNLSSDIPYTETKFNFSGPAFDSQYPKDGQVVVGDTWFNSDSEYFTNLYPGLFVMGSSFHGGAIDTFSINGDLGADGSGYVTTDSYTLTGYSNYTYTVYIKKVQGAYDPTVNHIIIVNTDGSGITHDFSTNTNNDYDQLSGLGSVTKMYYLLASTHGSNLPVSKSEIDAMVIAFLDLVDGSPTLSDILTVLNDNYTTITDILPIQSSEMLVGVMGNKIVDSTINCLNFTGGFIAFNKLTNACVIIDNVFSPSISSSFSWNEMTNFSYIGNNIIGNNCSMYGNTMNYSSMYDNVLSSRNLSMGSNANIDSNQLEFSNINDNKLKNSSIYQNNLSRDSRIDNNNLTYSTCNYNNLRNNCQISSNVGLDGFVIQSNNLSQESIIANNNSDTQGNISNNELSVNSMINNNLITVGSIGKNKLFESQIIGNALNTGGVLNYVQINENTLNINCNIANNGLEDGSSIMLNTLDTYCTVDYNNILGGTSISWNKLSQASRIEGNIGLDNSEILYNNLYIQSSIFNFTGTNVGVNYNTFKQSYLNLQSTTMPSTYRIKSNEFSNVNISDNLSSATFIYADYSKNIVKNQLGDTRITYINSANVLGVEEVTS